MDEGPAQSGNRYVGIRLGVAVVGFRNPGNGFGDAGNRLGDGWDRLGDFWDVMRLSGFESVSKNIFIIFTVVTLVAISARVEIAIINCY